MPRGNWRIVLAGLGCLTLGNAEHYYRSSHHQKHQQTPAKPSVVPKTPDTPTAKQTEQPCYPNSEHGISCDGISAKAAVDQARDADKGTALLWPQFGVGIFTLVAAIAAAIFAERAAHHTKRSADIAEKTANETVEALGIAARNADSTAEMAKVARENAQTELRAYLAVGAMELVKDFPPKPEDTHIWLGVKFDLLNAGRTPAQNIGQEIRVVFISEEGTHNLPETVSSIGYIAPGDSAIQRNYWEITPEAFEDIYADRSRMQFVARISYMDIFDKRHFLTAKFFTQDGLLVIPQNGMIFSHT